MACSAPLTIKYNPPIPDGSGGLIYTFPADCGKCLDCLTKLKSQWSFRLVEEKRNSFSSYFVTLTYDDQHLTWGDDIPTINPLDHELFIKNLKKLENQRVLLTRTMVSQEELERAKRGINQEGKIKYFGVSEYGDQFGRPHWHYIIFNVRDSNNLRLAWTDRKIKTLKKNGYKPSNVGSQKGNVHIDECNVNTIDYTLKYMLKDHSSTDFNEKQKEVRRMSKGLGDSIVNDEFKGYINRLDGNQVMSVRGSRVALPRYYRKKYIDPSMMPKKNAYIAEQLSNKEQELMSKFGKDYDKIVALSKDEKNHLLKTRRKRNKT